MREKQASSKGQTTREARERARENKGDVRWANLEGECLDLFPVAIVC